MPSHLLFAAGAEVEANRFPDIVYYLIVDALFIGFMWLAFSTMKIFLRVLSKRRSIHSLPKYTAKINTL